MLISILVIVFNKLYKLLTLVITKLTNQSLQIRPKGMLTLTKIFWLRENSMILFTFIYKQSKLPNNRCYVHRDGHRQQAVESMWLGVNGISPLFPWK